MNKLIRRDMTMLHRLLPNNKIQEETDPYKEDLIHLVVVVPLIFLVHVGGWQGWAQMRNQMRKMGGPAVVLNQMKMKNKGVKTSQRKS